MFGLFAKRRRPDPEQVRRIKAWLSARVALAEDDVVLIAELACTEPGCPPLETVITVMPPTGKRREWRLEKPVAEIGEDDVAALLEPRP